MARMQLKKNRNRLRNYPIVKNGFLPFPTSLALGIPTIRCTDLTLEESGYLEMESELFVLRQGSRNLLTYLYLFGDGKRFDGLPEHDLSGILMAQAEHTYLTDDSANSFGLRLRHTYYDRFDFSDLGLPYSMQVQSNKSEVIPHLSHRFTDKIAAKIEVSAGSERFDEPSENNSDQQLRVAFDWQVTEKVNLESKLGDPLTTMPAGEGRPMGLL